MKKMSKRVLAFAMALMLVLSGLGPVTAYAQEGEPARTNAESWMDTAEELIVNAGDTAAEATAYMQAGESVYFKILPEEDALYNFASFGWNSTHYVKLMDAEGMELTRSYNPSFNFYYYLEAENAYYFEIIDLDEEEGEYSCPFNVTGYTESYMYASESDVMLPYGETTELKVYVSDDCGVAGYQWYRWGEVVDENDPEIVWEEFIPIDGATSSTYEVTGNEDTSTQYQCKLLDGEGNELNYVDFFITIDTGLKVEYESNVTVSYQGETELSVSASTQVGPLSYQWYIYDENTTEYSLVEGATDSTYTVSGTANMEKRYTCRVFDKINSVDADFYLSLDTGLVIPDYESDIQVPYGEMVDLTVVVTGGIEGEDYSYQWYRLGKVVDENDPENWWLDWVSIDGETTSTYTVTGDEDLAEQYKCDVTDGYATPVSVWFNTTIDTGLELDAESENLTVEYEGTVTLTVIASGGVEPLTYTWYAHDADTNSMEEIPDVSTNTYQVVGDENASTRYYCEVSDAYGARETKWFYLEINSGITIGEYDSDVIVPYGKEATLTVNATCEGRELSYQWYREIKVYDEEDPENWWRDFELISGATTASYKVKGTADMASQYYCRVSDGISYQNVEFYTTLDTGLTIDSDYRNITIPYDGSKTLTLHATGGAGALQYQWYYLEYNTGDWCVLAGATNNSYTVSKQILETIDDGEYVNTLKCDVTDGVVTKACEYYLTIDSGLKIDKTVDNVSIGLNETKTLSVNAINEIGTLTYTWYYYTEEDEDGDSDCICIEEATSNTYEITGDANMPLQYECRVSDGVKTETCNFYIELDSGLEVTAENQDIRILAGQPLNLGVLATGGTGNYTYQWYYWGLIYDEEEDSSYTDDVKMLGETNATLHVETPDAEIRQYKCIVKDGISIRELTFYVNIVDAEAEFDFSNGCEVEGTIDNIVSKWYLVNLDATKAYRLYATSEAEADSCIRIYNEQLEQLADSDDEKGSWHFDTNFVFKADTTYYIEIMSYRGDFTVSAVELNGLVVSADGSTFVEISYGDTVDLKVAATSSLGEVTYQWYYWDDSTESEIEIPNATAATYRVDTGENSAGKYTCRVTDNETTEKIEFEVNIDTGLEVNCDNRYPVIPLGETVEVTVTATGSSLVTQEGGAYTYQWCYWDDETETRIEIPGKTSATIELTADENLKEWYVCMVSDGVATEGYAIWPTVDTGLKIYGTSEYLEMAYGETATLSTTVTGGVGELTYTWSKSVYVGDGVEGGWRDVIIEGATGSTYDLYADENASDTYYCTITDGYNTVYKQFYINYLGTIRDLKEVADISLSQTSMVYTGAALNPEPIVKDGNTTLVKGTHYTVEWSNNINAGKNTATVTIKGIGKYKGTVQKPFTITAASISGAKVAASNGTYTGAEQKPTVTVTLNGKTLRLNYDYTIVGYKNNINAGNATVTIAGKNNYAGTATGTFTINKASIKGAVVSVSDVTYTGAAQNPTVTVKVGSKILASSDYTVSYSNNINKGIATVVVTGKGNYEGTATATFKVNTASIANATVAVEDVYYKGKALKPTVTVKVGNVTLKEGTDYTVAYSNNSKIGTAKVTVTGIGNYAGTKEASFKIKKGASITVGDYKYTITGNATVAFAGIKKDTTKKVTVAATVKYAGKTFKVTSIADNALKGKKKVTQVTIGKNVTTIGKSAFEGCTKLSKVTIGAKVTKIDDKAFKKCTALKSITIPSKVTTIGKEAFSGAKNLKTITVKATKITSVGKNAFKDINKKATIKVPSKQYKKYKTLLKKGQAKTVKIKK